MWRIAVIDDDRQVLKGMKKQLPWHEFDLEWAGEAMDGKEGLRLIAETKPDIVFTDVYMPVMNGLAMAEELRRTGFSGKIIVLSGYSDFEYARQALRLNVFDYLSKPISPQTLRDVLDKAICELESESVRESEREELQRRLQQYEPYVEREWLTSIVTGAYDAGSVHKNREGFVRKHLAGRVFRVVGFRLPRQERTEGATASGMHLFRFAVGNIIDEIMQEEWPDGVRIELNGQQSVLLLHAAPGTDDGLWLEAVRRLVDRSVECVRSYLRLTLQAGIGGLKGDWKEIADSTEEAFHFRQAAEGRKTAGSTVRSVKFYHTFTALLRQGQLEELGELAAEFAGQWKDAGQVSPAELAGVASELLTVIEYAQYNDGKPGGLETGGALAAAAASIQDPEGLERWMRGLVECISGDRQWGDNVRHKKAVEFVIQYIHEHYDQDITLGDLTEKVFISRNYLSQIFRHATGETFNGYLTRVRMEKAKGLIQDGNHLIYEVAEMVGYKSVAYFSNLFKKYTGMNPSDLFKGS